MSKSSNGVSLPVETLTKGGVNDSVTEEERMGVTPVGLREGPRVEPEKGTYLPATYRTQNGNIRVDR